MKPIIRSLRQTVLFRGRNTTAALAFILVKPMYTDSGPNDGKNFPSFSACNAVGFFFLWMFEGAPTLEARSSEVFCLISFSTNPCCGNSGWFPFSLQDTSSEEKSLFVSWHGRRYSVQLNTNGLKPCVKRFERNYNSAIIEFIFFFIKVLNQICCYTEG